MVAIPGGKFLMGSPESEQKRWKIEEPQHLVSVKPFFMGKFQITQAQWRAIASLPKVKRDLNPAPSKFKGNDRRPVECVNWYDAVEFCARLSILSGRVYRGLSIICAISAVKGLRSLYQLNLCEKRELKALKSRYHLLYQIKLS